jgi:hypothetical protein
MKPTHLSFQKFFNSSIVLAAPRIRANKTSTPPSPRPQKELQKSKERMLVSGEVVRAYLASDVVDDCLLADMIRDL